MKETTGTRLILLVTLFLVSFGNKTFFLNVTEVYLVNLNNIAFLGSLALLFVCAMILLFSVLCYKKTIKPVLISLLLISSFASYFMDTYHVIIDDTMIQNIISTDIAESMDLVSFKLFLYVALLGILPSVWIYNVKIVFSDFRTELRSRIKLFSLSLAVAISIVLIFSPFYASFFREHKILRYYTTPASSIYATAKYINRSIKRETLPLMPIGLDAKISATDTDRELIIFVVGETARADRFSLNGYERETNPLLKKEAVTSFSNVWACGTSTALSVPCMFSIYNQSEYSDAKAQTTENILDILKRAGIAVTWLDNNSDSKGVALRVNFEDYKRPEKNPICDLECRDEGMLANLQTYIDNHQEGDLFIVLHQMGNHGPAYYKRYPKTFEKFSPACQTNQLENCSKEEIDNAYDNAILYTDYFLSKVIQVLKDNDAQFETALFYVSDHGESLGEHGVYLHGLPYFIAPDEQLRVPAIMWFGDNFNDPAVKSLSNRRDGKYSHDNIFHTILGFMEIETSLYNKELDIIHGVQ